MRQAVLTCADVAAGPPVLPPIGGPEDAPERADSGRVVLARSMSTVTPRQRLLARLGRGSAAGMLLGAVAIAVPSATPAAAHGHHDGPAATRPPLLSSGFSAFSAFSAQWEGRPPRMPPAPDRRRDAPPWRETSVAPSVAEKQRPSALPRYTTPVTDFPVSAPYGIPGGWLAGRHTGVDFAVPVGTPVRSVAAGRVVHAAYSGAYGHTVVVRMRDGYHALYAHLSRVAVEPGQKVPTGAPLGLSGNTGRSSGPHLHFEIRTDRDYGSDVDPVGYLRGHGVRLVT